MGCGGSKQMYDNANVSNQPMTGNPPRNGYNYPPPQKFYGQPGPPPQVQQQAPSGRKQKAVLLALRTGHGDFKWYHIRFKHETSNNYCSCGQSKGPRHIVWCKRIRASFFDWPLKPITQPNNTSERLAYLRGLLASPRDFAKYLQVTRFYTNICP